MGGNEKFREIVKIEFIFFLTRLTNNIIQNFTFSIISMIFSQGVFRECFSTSFQLGRRSSPVKVTDTCQLQRTQGDPNSSIRACICTTNFCNGQEETKNANNLIDDGNFGI